MKAFKCTEAYNRNLNFLPDDEKKASAVFGTHPSEISEQDKIIFGNYIFNRFCEMAAEWDLPFQIHTGLGDLAGSQPILLLPLL